MSQSRRKSSGFSNTPKSQTSSKKLGKSSADHFIKEEEAVALMDQGRLQEAESIYRELIAAGTNNHIVYGNLAALCGMQGRYSELIKLLRRTLEIKPNYPEAHYNLGLALKEQGDLTAAITSYNKALQLRPNYPEAHNNLGNAYKDQGDLTAAIASYNSALQLNPNDPETHNNLGVVLKKQGDPTAAITSYHQALQLQPNYPEAHYNLGIAFKEQGDLTAAIASYNKALQLKPNDADTYNNLGNALKEQGELTAAIDSFNKALQLKPNFPDAQWNSALTMLLGGDYKNGWEKYEWRTKGEKEHAKPHAIPKCKQRSGKLDLRQSDPLLLVTEQGLGDTLQFMRYAIALRDKGISISLCAQPKLHPLIKASGIDPSPLTPKQANQVMEGEWMPLLSVPGQLEVSPSNPVFTDPYIKTKEDLTKKWADILGEKPHPVIGINWQGNPQAEKAGVRGRSLALEAFAPIANNTHISLLSLQKGFGSEQLDTCSFKERFVSCQDQINETWDFLETAAIIGNCDLVITSDTAVAHLAGGMGKTTWLLLHKVPDWRWGLEGDTTFWYPSMRLFRQKDQGNWHEVMERVAEALQKQFGSTAMPTEPTSPPQTSAKPQPIQDILAPISLGELIDKITILQIKTQHLQGAALVNVQAELNALETTLNNLQLNLDPTHIQRLKQVNQDLWQIEDDIRDQERRNNFDETFIRLARSVYQQNDQRAAIKKEINTTYGSVFVEEKSYQQY